MVPPLAIGVGVVPPINFYAHMLRTGSPDGARADFEQMNTQLVAHLYPGVRSVDANPGDWGIDTFVGSLDSSSVMVWQSKYFIDGVGETQKDQIRESFKSAVAAAETHGHSLDAWILCIPQSMDGPTSKWWDGWKKRTMKKHSIEIELWDDTELRKRLISPEGKPVRYEYYAPTTAVPAGDNTAVRPVPDELDLSSALFVRQLEATGHVEHDSAKQQFFNAEYVAREVLDKGLSDELAQLISADAEVQSVWESRFNAACEAGDLDRLPGLHGSVMREVEEKRLTLMPRITTSTIHVSGMMHRVVEDGRAGWTRAWRGVVDLHASERGERDAVVERATTDA